MSDKKDIPDCENQFPILEEMAISDSQKQVLAAMRGYAEDVAKKLKSNDPTFMRPAWIQLEGKPGVGKTAAIEAFINYLTGAGVGQYIHYQRETDFSYYGVTDYKIRRAVYPEEEQLDPMEATLEKMIRGPESPLDKAVRESQEIGAAAERQKSPSTPVKVVVVDDLFFGQQMEPDRYKGSLSIRMKNALGCFAKVVGLMETEKFILISTSNIPQRDVIDAYLREGDHESPAIHSRLCGMEHYAVTVEGPDMRAVRAAHDPDAMAARHFGAFMQKTAPNSVRKDVPKTGTDIEAEGL